MKKRLDIFCILLAGLLSSCSATKEEHPIYEYPIWADLGVEPGKTYPAIASAKTFPDGTRYLQVNDKLSIVDPDQSHRTWEKDRVYCEFMLLNRPPETKFCWAEILWYEDVEPGGLSAHGDKGDSPGGPAADDGLDVIEDWMTSLEDGYLTIHYSAWWGDGRIRHSVYLTRDSSGEFTLVHNANGDARTEKADALVYFDINTLFSDTDENDVITLKWKTCAGETAEKQFLFKGRTE